MHSNQKRATGKFPFLFMRSKLVVCHTMKIQVKLFCIMMNLGTSV